MAPKPDERFFYIQEVYQKAYNAGKDDIIEETKLRECLMYADICGTVGSLLESKQISDIVYNKIMQTIDRAFEKSLNQLSEGKIL